jgi:PBSX family phage portal protein
MEEMLTKMADEEYEYVVPARLNTQEKEENIFKGQDPFIKSWEELKSLGDLETNFKRKTTRTEKAYGGDYTSFSNVDTRNAARPYQSETMAPYLEDAKAYPTGQDANSKQLNPGTVYRNGYGIFDVITPPYNLYELANFYDTSFANHAAIDAKVENVVGLGYEFQATDSTMLRFEMQDDKEAVDRARKRIERMKLQMRDWLESLNDDDSFTKTMEKVYTDVQATGNGYVEVGRTVNGDIGYVGHIPSTTLRVRRLKDGYVQIIGQKLVYFRNFGATNQNPLTADPRPNEIIHIKEYSPLNTYYGVPDIIAALPSLIGDQLASQYNIDYFENKAVPRYIIMLKGAKLSPDAEDKMFRFLQTGLKAQSHRTLYIPLPGDSDHNKVEFEMKAIENGIQEGSFKEYRKQNRDDIFIAHQMPISKIGGSDAGGLAAALSQDRTFKEQVSRPEQRNLEKTINKIIKEKTDVLEFKFNELTLTDEIAQSQILERYVKNQIMLPNEAREVLNLPQVEHGDKPLELTARAAADANANNAKTRTRDGERTNNQSDSTATVAGRNAKGQGRSSQ